MIAHRLRDTGLKWYARLPPAPIQESSNGPTILLIRPDHIGDVLFLGPSLVRLRAALPDAKVQLAVGPWAETVAQHLPGIDEIVTIPFPSFDRHTKQNALAPYFEMHRWATKLGELGSWLAVVLRDDDWWSALVVQRAGITQRLGSDHNLVEPFLSDRLSLSGNHWVERNAQMIDAAIAMLGGMPATGKVAPSSAPLRWRIDNRDIDGAMSILDAAKVGDSFICIAPGSGAPVKLWPVNRWIAVGRSLVRQFRVRIAIAGSPADVEMSARIAAGIGSEAISIAGKTTLPILAAVFQRSRLVLGPDSGPLHLAVAVGTPTIHLYGPSSVEQFGPWGDPGTHRVVCKAIHCPECGNLDPRRPAGAGCMLAISVEDVIGQARELVPGG